MIDEILEVLFDVVGEVNINGDSYKGKSITIQGTEVLVDGEVRAGVSGSLELIVNIIGNVAKVKTVSGDIQVQGDCTDLQTTSGDINCWSVDGDVQTVSGDVNCGAVAGDVKTVSGNIRYR